MQNDLYVNFKKMYNDGGTLIDNSDSMKNDVDSISDLISKEWNSWLGDDSSAYVNSLSNLLDNLSSFCAEVNHIGAYMQNIASDYESTITRGVRELNEDE